MALILNLDTATERASVCLSKQGKCIKVKFNNHQKEHASFVSVAIQQILEESGIRAEDLDAVACTIGPGSYTGLRVGLATAKGLCFALNKPLIGINTLKVMAVWASKLLMQKSILPHRKLLCPMIDARRMEVFVGLYTMDLEEILLPCSMVLTENSFSEWRNQSIVCCGSGSEKFRALAKENIQFVEHEHSACDLGELAEDCFSKEHFLDIAYSTPIYLKEFYTLAN
jgi:tRNA threonylcarbamoyladenosine biosynthesis protein TsaB